MSKIYHKHQFQEARAFLKNAKVISGYESPVEKSTTYLKDGVLYYEYWSKLEAPEDDYYVAFVLEVQ